MREVLYLKGNSFITKRVGVWDGLNQEGRGSIADLGSVTSLPTPRFPHPHTTHERANLGVRELWGGEGGH